LKQARGELYGRNYAMVNWRWIDSGAGDGLTNMATDFVIAQSINVPSIPTMHVYQWDPKCISIGFHQSAERIDLKLCQKHHVDVVRRPTGGRAVFHVNEVTYSVFIPAHMSQSNNHKLYLLISQGLVEGIRQLGIPAEFKKSTFDFGRYYQTIDGLSCFSATARYEVMVYGKKLIGSAQRHDHYGILQQGSIMIGHDHLKLPDYYIGLSPKEKEQMKLHIRKKTVTIEDCLERKISYHTVSEVVRNGIEKVFGVRFQEQGLHPQEKELVQELKASFVV